MAERDFNPLYRATRSCSNGLLRNSKTEDIRKVAKKPCNLYHIFALFMLLVLTLQVSVRYFYRSLLLRKTSNFSSIASHSSETLHVYWIVSSSDYDSYATESAVKALLSPHSKVALHLVPRVSENEAIAAVQLGLFRALKASVLKRLPLLSLLKGGDITNMRTFAEVSSMMSHLNAIQSAFVGLSKTSENFNRLSNNEKHHDFVLIVDGGVPLLSEFSKFINRQWKPCIGSAPQDWNVLQLYSSARRGSPINEHRHHLAEDWISWQGDHLGAAAYVINLAGMSDILRRTRINQNGTIWTVPAWEGPAWPEDVLFYKATTYTSTHRWFSGHPDHAVSSYPPVQAHGMQFSSILGSRRVLVLQICYIQGANKLKSYLLKIRTDVQEMSKWHKDFLWEVTLAFKSNKLYQKVRKNSSSLVLSTENVRWTIVFAPNRFNKYHFVKPHVKKFLDYEYVLLKDADQRIAGFPWKTFMFSMLNSKAIIAGPLRESPLESRYPQKKKRQWFQINDASFWKYGPRFFRQRFTEIESWSVKYIEQYFAIFDGAFAHWFFEQILVDEFMTDEDGSKLVSSWGPDFMWCGAAASYISEILPKRFDQSMDLDLQPCVLVPVSSLHEDTREIQRVKSRPHTEQMAIDMKPVHLYARKFSSWLQYSSKFRSTVGGISLSQDIISRTPE